MRRHIFKTQRTSLTLQHTWNHPRHTAPHCNTTVTHYNTLQHRHVFKLNGHLNVLKLQHTATPWTHTGCNTLQHPEHTQNGHFSVLKLYGIYTCFDKVLFVERDICENDYFLLRDIRNSCLYMCTYRLQMCTCTHVHICAHNVYFCEETSAAYVSICAHIAYRCVHVSGSNRDMSCLCDKAYMFAHIADRCAHSSHTHTHTHTHKCAHSYAHHVYVCRCALYVHISAVHSYTQINIYCTRTHICIYTYTYRYIHMYIYTHCTSPRYICAPQKHTTCVVCVSVSTYIHTAHLRGMYICAPQNTMSMFADSCTYHVYVCRDISSSCLYLRDISSSCLYVCTYRLQMCTWLCIPSLCVQRDTSLCRIAYVYIVHIAYICAPKKNRHM